ncbi:hypothetical protein, partial [Microseira sp. BLCC-F43]|uniref:hypothetical protein n=1 Tax=Microseira sp. BLCC-F43 TaxID=3153602 RepID=UPI0035B9F846
FVCRGTAAETFGTREDFMIAVPQRFVCRGTAAETFGTREDFMIAVPRRFLIIFQFISSPILSSFLGYTPLGVCLMVR